MHIEVHTLYERIIFIFEGHQCLRQSGCRSCYGLSCSTDHCFLYDGHDHHEIKTIFYSSIVHFNCSSSKRQGSLWKNNFIYLIQIEPQTVLKHFDKLHELFLLFQYVPFLRSRALHLSLIAILVAGMSIEGVSNLKKQHDTIGNYF